MSTPTQTLSPARPFQRTPLTSRAIPGSSVSIPTGPSPAYTTNLRSRHSLYGTDDRVVLDLGSCTWKAGFSSETRPRVVISVHELCGCDTLWNLSNASTSAVAEDAIAHGLRRLFFEFLMIDPKMRKVLLIEPALVPIDVRSRIAVVLFDQLHVPSICFTSSPVLVLMATGTITGLVIDVGNLETSALPVYLSRPLFPLIRSTTRASARLSARLRALLLRFASFIPIPKFGQSSTSSTAAAGRGLRVSRVPRELLTKEVIEDIKTRLLLVAKDRLQPHDSAYEDTTSTELSPAITSPQTSPTIPSVSTSIPGYSEESDTVLLDALARSYKRSSSAQTKDVIYKLPSIQPSQSNPRAPCVGVLRIPGWLRERAADVLFHSTSPDMNQIPEEEDESLSVVEVVLECLWKLPIDLRKPLAANLVVCGGGAMLPGFITRLKTELIHTLDRAQGECERVPRFLSHTTSSSTDSSPPPPNRAKLHRPRYRPISSLANTIFILNDRQPSSAALASASGRTRPPAFQMHLLAWLGGSLAGAMRIGGQEVIREHWDSVVESSLVSQELGVRTENQLASEEEETEEDGERFEWERKLIGLKTACGILPDWTRLSIT